MHLQLAWRSIFLLVVSVSANLPPVPGSPVYYNTTGLSASLQGPTHASSGTGPGTVFRRGLTEASASSASVSSSSRTKFTHSPSFRPTGQPPHSSGSVKPSYFPTASRASTAATGKPSYISSTIKRTVLSTGFTYHKRAIPSATSKLASTGILPSGGTRSRISTGYTYSRPSSLPSGSVSTSASFTLPKSSLTSRTSLSTGYTYSRPSQSPSGSGYSRPTSATTQPSTGPTSKSSSLPASSATSLPPYPTGNFSATSTVLPSTFPSPTPPSTFRVQIFVTANEVGSPNIDGAYISVHPDENGQDALLIVPDFPEASLFTLNVDGSLQSGDELAAMPAGGTYGRLLMETAVSGGLEKTICQNRGGVLNCAAENDVAFLTCDAGPNRFVEAGLKGKPNKGGCVEFLLLVVWGR